MSLRLRLTLFYSVFIAVILSAVAVSVYALTQQSLNASLEERARQAILDLSRGSVGEGLRRLPSEAYHEIRLTGSPARKPDTIEGLRPAVRYTAFDGERRNPTQESLFANLSDSALATLLADGRVSTSVELPTGGRVAVLAALGNLTVQQDAPFPGQSFSAVFLVGIPAQQTAALLDQLASNLRLTVILAFLAFALGVWLLSKQVLSPVQRVTHAAARVTSRDLSQRVPVPRSNDEMKELAVTLNSMLERLQESFETQRRFTADASHELRTPVTSIVGHTNYLLRRTQPKPEQVDSLTVIRREAERMAKLVNDLLELARADAGFSITKEPMNLVEVVEAVHMEIAPVAGNTVIEIDSPHPLIEVLGDPARLKQVVLNLVQNAVNAGASRIAITLSREKQRVRLEVLDDGPGIPAEAIPHLFDRFFRVDGARSTRGNGSGLGLAIVRWIVQQHGGTVTVESRLGEGTLFTVLLPVRASKPSDPTPQRQVLAENLAVFRRD